MPTLQIRDVPIELHEKLSNLAKGERRSLSQQVLYLLEKVLAQEDNQRTRREILISQIRERSPEYLALSDPTKIIRTDREE